MNKAKMEACNIRENDCKIKLSFRFVLKPVYSVKSRALRELKRSIKWFPM